MNAAYYGRLVQDTEAERETRTLLVFADHLADGLDPRQAAKLMGKRAASGDVMLEQIRQKLGRQAI